MTFPNTWKQPEITHYFREIGPIYINWLNDCSAFIALSNRHLSSYEVFQKLEKSNNVSVVKFEEYKNIIKEHKSDNQQHHHNPIKTSNNESHHHKTNEKQNKRRYPEHSSKSSTPILKKKKFEEHDAWD